jgi:hypothetical protein
MHLLPSFFGYGQCVIGLQFATEAMTVAAMLAHGRRSCEPRLSENPSQNYQGGHIKVAS